jgi:hypothetical protein
MKNIILTVFVMTTIDRARRAFPEFKRKYKEAELEIAEHELRKETTISEIEFEIQDLTHEYATTDMPRKLYMKKRSELIALKKIIKTL